MVFCQPKSKLILVTPTFMLVIPTTFEPKQSSWITLYLKKIADCATFKTLYLFGRRKRTSHTHKVCGQDYFETMSCIHGILFSLPRNCRSEITNTKMLHTKSFDNFFFLSSQNVHIVCIYCI